MTERRQTKRAATGDRGPPDEPAILTVEQISPKLSKTPNGNLLCEEVPIARAGWMIYGPNEVPITVDPLTGYSRVYRGEDELFSAKTIGSFMGVAVVDEHPDEDVTPQNWKKYAQGFSTVNVRRGTGDNADVLLADLIITDEDLIQAVLDGKREVSCGYDADYDQDGVGVGRQTNIIGNHIALVEKGRCGPRCAIGDRAFVTQPPKGNDMGKRVTLAPGTRRVQLRDALRKTLDDATALLEDTSGISGGDDDVDEGGGGDTHIHIHAGSDSELPAGAPTGVAASGPTPNLSQDDGEGGEGGEGADPIEARFQAIEGTLQQISATLAKLTGGGEPDGDEGGGGEQKVALDDAGNIPEGLETEQQIESAKTMDSAALETGYQSLLSDAEILVPGFRVPTFDRAASRKATIDSMCATRRRVLDIAYATGNGKTVIDGVTGKTDLDMTAMTCVDVATTFRAAVGATKLLNNKAATKDSSKMADPQMSVGGGTKPAMTIAELNKANDEFWAKTSMKV